MRIKKLGASLLVCLLSSLSIHAKTIHFISMFDTKDESIGDGMKMECAIMNNEFQTIAGYMEDFGFDSEISQYSGDNCGKGQLMSVMNSLDVAPDDIVLFYYGGHGGRPLNSTDNFPQMCLGHRNEANFVPATLIKNIIAKKGPQLTIVMTGCCNSEDKNISVKSVVAQAQGYTNEKQIDKSRFKKLFGDIRGSVQLTSSRPGEFSFCGGNGSIFAHNLLEVLSDVGSGLIEADWNVVCKEVKSRISDLTITCKGQNYSQHPYYEVNLNRIGENRATDDKRDNPTVKRRVNDENYDLLADISILLDKSKSKDERLKMIPAILEKHFNYGAKVMTLGVI